MTKLILIRHGETDYNLDNRYCGFSDPALNNKGIRQSKRLAIRLKDVNIDKVYSSDLQRSYESAKIIFKDSPIEKVRDFREMNFGVFEGLTYKQIMERHPLIYKKWLKNPFGVDIPSGEKMSHFINRIKKELKNIIKNNSDKTIALITHSGPIRLILNTVLRTKKEDFWRLKLKPQTAYIIEYKNSSKPQVYEAI